jgi:hypothetical protein
MIFPSSAIRCAFDGPDVLVIHRPPAYSAAFWFFFFALVLGIPLILSVSASIRNGQTMDKDDLKTVLGGACILMFLFAAFVVYDDQGTATLSRKEGTLTVIDGSGAKAIYPLQNLQSVIISGNGYGSSKMIFVLSNGNVSLGIWMGRDGEYQAANAANSFLSGSMSNTYATPSTSVPQVPGSEKEMQRKLELQQKDYQERLRNKQSDKTLNGK